jgi:hypothetical protein
MHILKVKFYSTLIWIALLILLFVKGAYPKLFNTFLDLFKRYLSEAK